MVFSETFSLETQGFADVVEITGRVEEIISASGMRDGIVTVFCPGSTATVTTIEYEPGVVDDLKKALERLVPSGVPYEHDRRWGDGNGFSHVRAALMKPSLTIPLVGGVLRLGTWQQIVLVDFDNRGRRRDLIVQGTGE